MPWRGVMVGKIWSAASASPHSMQPSRKSSIPALTSHACVGSQPQGQIRAASRRYMRPQVLVSGLSRMTDDYEDWEAPEELAWVPKTRKEEREALGYAPLATLRAQPATAQAAALMRDLAERYSRPQAANGKAYARGKTLVRYANACGAFVADLLVASADKRSEGWLRCSHKKTEYTGKYVKWATFDVVRKAWLEAGLIWRKTGGSRALSVCTPRATSGLPTRHRATPKRLQIAAARRITPAHDGPT